MASRNGERATTLIVAIWLILLVTAEVALLVLTPWIAPAMTALLVTLAVAPLALLLARHRTDSAALRRDAQALTAAMETVTQESGLSEGAKRVLHRREERELLRRALEQDIADRDWDAAMVLVKELAERFGYRADAEGFRKRIERARAQTLDSEVIEALHGLDDAIRNARWQDAYGEAARIQRLYPESHRVDGLRERVDQARARYRKELERQFLVAAQREDVDQAMELLRELDQYLTPTEAEPLQEVARGVIGKSRENLGVRFKLMVHDRHWREAVDVGEQIIAEFPNTKMAEEVRQLLPALRDRS